MDSAIQLWSVRLATEADGWTDTLEHISRIGFARVEPYAIHITAPAIAAGLEHSGLTAPSSHGFLDPEHLEATLEAAVLLGVSHVVHPHLDVEAWEDEAAIDRTAAMLVDASNAARPRGISIGFHNHDYELVHEVNGQPAMFALMDLLPEEISVEFDVYWAAIARVDPVDALRLLSGRVRALHIKDGPFGATPSDQLALGAGELDLDEIIAAVPDDTLLVLSLDRMPGTESDIWAAVEASRDWLDERTIA